MTITEEKFNELKNLGCREFNSVCAIEVLRGTNLWGYYSWGVSRLINIGKVGLLMKVNGRHHKGWVYLTLNSGDLYDVHLLNNRYEKIETIEDVFFFELFDVIDKKIEWVPEYKN